MCDTRNDLKIIIPGIAFWAFDKATNKRADFTGYAVCTQVLPWAILAVDIVGCERVFLNRMFRFEVL